MILGLWKAYTDENSSGKAQKFLNKCWLKSHLNLEVVPGWIADIKTALVELIGAKMPVLGLLTPI